MLVVEDDPDSREALAETKQSFGAHVEIAGSTQETLALIEKARFSLSDLAMPVVDGFELIREVRTRPDAASCAQRVSKGPRTRNALAAGFQLCIIKPISLQQFIRISSVGRS